MGDSTESTDAFADALEHHEEAQVTMDGRAAVDAPRLSWVLKTAEGQADDGNEDMDEVDEFLAREETATDTAVDDGTPSSCGRRDSSEVFEIRDFTTATPLERLSRQMELVIEQWKRNGLFDSQRPAANSSVKESAVFVFDRYTYRLSFYRAHTATPTTPTTKGDDDGAQLCQGSSGLPSPLSMLSSLHRSPDFPVRCPRLQRWFGVTEYLCLELLNESNKCIDLHRDAVPPVLSALSVAARTSVPSRPLACFLASSATRHRYSGHLLVRGEGIGEGEGVWVTYETDCRDMANAADAKNPVGQILGLADFLGVQLSLSSPSLRGLTLSCRFTYVVDHWQFPPLQPPTVGPTTKGGIGIRRPPSPFEDAFVDVSGQLGATGGVESGGERVRKTDSDAAEETDIDMVHNEGSPTPARSDQPSARSRQTTAARRMGSPSQSKPTKSEITPRPPRPPQGAHTWADDDAAMIPEPIGALHLSCTWPPMTLGSFLDLSLPSSLPPDLAPRWSLRVLPSSTLSPTERRRLLPACRRARMLAELLSEGRGVKSVLGRLNVPVASTALGAIGVSLMESLESVLMPSAEEVTHMVTRCFEPLPPLATSNTSSSTSSSSASSSPPPPPSPYPPITASPWTQWHSNVGPPSAAAAAAAGNGPASDTSGGGLEECCVRLKGCPPGTLLWRVAALSGDLRSFKGLALLWSRVVAELRARWEACTPIRSLGPLPDGMLGTPTIAHCLLHQKLQLLNCAIVQKAIMKRRGQQQQQQQQDASHAPLQLQVHPPLTEDGLILYEARLSALPTDEARRDMLYAPLRSDAQAYRRAYPSHAVTDFVAWRHEYYSAMGSEATRLTDEAMAALKGMWDECGRAAAGGSHSLSLFNPDFEAEMALHYFENLTGVELTSQLLTSFLSGASHALLSSPLATLHLPLHTHLCQLIATRIASAFTTSQHMHPSPSSGSIDKEQSGWGQEGSVGMAMPRNDGSLQEALDGLEEGEIMLAVATSLSDKLPGQGALISRLMSEEETIVATEEERNAVSQFFARCNASTSAFHQHTAVDQPHPHPTPPPPPPPSQQHQQPFTLPRSVSGQPDAPPLPQIQVRAPPDNNTSHQPQPAPQRATPAAARRDDQGGLSGAEGLSRMAPFAREYLLRLEGRKGAHGGCGDGGVGGVVSLPQRLYASFQSDEFRIATTYCERLG
ncbi:unnamed protein product [Vitrella brassicaformis CCMP3155]|uniref:Rab3 GTPase-activating protein catalytic subunit n=1 Tax=Vitrella brassicaformis (strain CCMP3155) TaxID=1169540 RepID=A0A0G4F2J6_VITBC|nr:unnamed protein product [Vitrella brassicaformis CCMP3155]|eukprot:CEM06423.1 unnamed protein product [Vitrella brassicaformis CCMP3155]